MYRLATFMQQVAIRLLLYASAERVALQRRHRTEAVLICSLVCSAAQVYNSYRFGFDRVYGPESTQEELYVHSARNAVHNVLQASCSRNGQLARVAGTLAVGTDHRLPACLPACPPASA